jgi:hypothetical protein
MDHLTCTSDPGASGVQFDNDDGLEVRIDLHRGQGRVQTDVALPHLHRKAL